MDMPVIMVTAFGEGDARAAAMALGAHGYVTTVGRRRGEAPAGGGGSGIRTHGGLAPTAVFKTAALNRSATPPCLNSFTGARVEPCRINAPAAA